MVGREFNKAYGSAYVSLLAFLALIAAARIAYIGLSQTPIPLEIGHLLHAAVLLGFGVFLRVRQYRPVFGDLCNALGFVQLAFLGAFASTQLVFYTGRDFPLVDASLANLDRALGFDWLAYVMWMDSHPVMATLGQAAYDSINAQPFVIVVVLILMRQTERAYALIGMMAAALTVTSATVVFLPALGPYAHFEVAVGDFSNMSLIPQTEWTVPIDWLRAAAFHTAIPPIKIGMISFPSYHAATAILYVWAAWRTPGLRWVALAINAALLLATPVCGAHYFVDVFAGIAVAVIVIGAMSWAFRTLCRTRFAMPARRPELDGQAA